MLVKVVYHSSTGNTRKLAEAMAQALNVQAEKMPERLSGPVDLLLVGDGIYAGKPSKVTRAFIDSLSPELVKCAAVFGTYGGQDKIGKDLQQRIRDKGVKVVGEPFTCKGKSWWLMNRDHPSQAELNEAKTFAKKMATKAR